MNQFQGLMFLQGYFTRPADLEPARTQYGARTAANDFAPALGNRAAAEAWLARGGREPTAAPAPNAVPEFDFVVARNTTQAEKPRRASNLLAQLLYLGGRPMHAGHNFDLDEPFDVPALDAVLPARGAAHTERRRSERRVKSARLQAQACNG